LQGVKTAFQTLLDVAGGRVARNIYFWIILIWTRMDFAYTPLQAVLTGILFVLLAVLFYVNNLLLLPRILARKQRLKYVISYSVLVFVVAALYTWSLKWTMFHHPEIHSGMISPLLTEEETSSLSIRSLFNEMWSYYIWLYFVGAVFAMSWFVMNYQRMQRRMDAAQKEHLQAELGFLKSQINPHFLFNTLNNLYALTTKKSDQAPETVAQLSVILRYFLYDSNVALVSSEKEKEIMQAYIDLELLRISNRENLQFDIETDKTYSIPPLLWVPVLENVFKHGTRFISESYDVHFRFTILKNVIRVYSRNTFKERSDSNGSNGIGISNLRKRLDLLYPNRYVLDTKREGSYFELSMEIDLAHGTH
jgi:LytS/YehU family sensor histidine kinase